jgi:hypothetical protein
MACTITSLFLIAMFGIVAAGVALQRSGLSSWCHYTTIDFWLRIGAAFPHPKTTKATRPTRETSQSSRPCGKPTTADTAVLADTRAPIKNPAQDTGSPAAAGQTYEPPEQHLAALF